MNTSEASRLLSIGSYRSFSKNDVLLEQNSDSADAALILSGIVKVAAVIHGHAEIVGIRGADTLVGEELALLGSETRVPGIHFRKATALTRGRAIIFRAKQLRDFLDENPATMLAVTRNLCGRLAEAEARYVSTARDSARSRLARVLCQLHDLHRHRMPKPTYATAHGAEIPVQLTQAELASWIGASRETVDKTLHDWRTRGIITTHQRKITILQPETLARLGNLGILP